MSLPKFSSFHLVSLVALVLTTLGLTAQEPILRQEWKAQWISHSTAPLREPLTLHFRKSLDGKEKPEHFVVHVSADNRFVLYVNGQRVGDGPARGDLEHWRYETFDLAPFLKAGNNTIAATVWNFAIYAPVSQITDRTAFLVEGDTAAEAGVNTDASWMVEEEPGQVPLPRKPDGFWAYIASGYGETLRAADFDWQWMTEPTTGGRWVAAGPALREAVYPGSGKGASRGKQADVPWQLVPDTLPHMAYRQEDAGKVVRESVDGQMTLHFGNGPGGPTGSFPAAFAAHQKLHLMLDRGELTTAYPLLKFSGGKGSHITLTYAEALYDAQQHKGNRNEVGDRVALGIHDEIYPDGGADRAFEPLWWRTWRYLDIAVETGDESLKLEGLEAYFTAFPFKQLASFASSDPELDKIWQIGWHTVELDAHETYMDAPYYEQLQYAGDTRVEELITYAVTGDDRLPRQAMRALDDSRIPEGITASRYPSNLAQYIPTFSLLWIGMIHDNYEYRGDREFVRGLLPGTRTVLDWFARYQHEDGLLAKVPWWSFIDWVETKADFPSYDSRNESCLTTLQYIGALEDAIDLETNLGGAQYVEMDRGRLAKAKAGVMSQCWDAKSGLVADSPAKDIFSQHANMLAVLHDVLPHEQQTAVMRKVLAKELGQPASGPELIEASYYFRFYLARALDHAGMADEYLKLLGSWHGFLKQGFTTWPEQPGDTRSDSHAWTAHPTYDLLTLVAGIGPGSPGFETVRIAPHLGGLSWLKATYPHAKGLIRVSYVFEGGILTAAVTLPPGLTGTFFWKSDVGAPLHSGENILRFR